MFGYAGGAGTVPDLQVRDSRSSLYWSGLVRLRLAFRNAHRTSRMSRYRRSRLTQPSVSLGISTMNGIEHLQLIADFTDLAPVSGASGQYAAGDFATSTLSTSSTSRHDNGAEIRNGTLETNDRAPADRLS
jgi:hypothetical protein